MKTGPIALGFIWMLGGMSGLTHAIELHSDTLKAWDDYIKEADSAMQSRVGPGRSFLWADEAPDRAARLRRGEVLVAPAVGPGTVEVPRGLIHHWIGAIFLPKATIGGLLAVIHDYDRYKDIYQPVVADSKGLACAETDRQFSMLWRHRVLFVTAAFQSQYEARDFELGGRRGFNIAATTQMQEIESYGKRGARLFPPGEGNGFLWRLHGIARYEERDGGVYLELEAIALTRDIPSSLKWLVSPVVSRLSINALMTTLRQTRDAVTTLAVPLGRPDSCLAPRIASTAAATD